MSEKNIRLLGPVNYPTMHSTCIRGDKIQLKHLLGTSEVSSLEVKDESGKTPLIYATIGNHSECVALLLKAGVIVDNVDHNGQTALHWAAYKGHWQCVKVLLDKGSVWYRKDLDGVTPLHLAAVHRSPKCLQLFLQAGNNYTSYDLWDSAKKTALHWSASVANYDHMKLLLKRDANVNIPDVEGRTPLHWAAACNSPRALDCVKLLLASSPSVLHEAWQDYQGKTALHLAVIMGTKEVVDVLTVSDKSLNLQDNLFRTPLHWAALMGLTEKARTLLDRGPNLSARDANGATPLHYAVHGDHADTVSAFLSNKSVCDDVDNYGCTAILWAAARGADKVLQVMKGHGADLNTTDRNNNTTLHAASLQGHASTVEWLIEQGCRTDTRNNCSQTPLLLACQVGRAKVLRVLLAKDSSSLHIRDRKGRTALHCAAIGGHALICQTLLQYKADPNVQDYYGLSPLHYASYKGSLNCMSVLIENGANPNCADNLGQTPLHWACLKGKLESVKFLCDANANPNSLARNDERGTPLDYALQSRQNVLLDYLKEKNALQSKVIIKLAALVIQKFIRNCSKRKGRQSMKLGLDPKWILKTAPDIMGQGNAGMPQYPNSYEMANCLVREDQTAIAVSTKKNLFRGPSPNESKNRRLEAKDISLSNVIYVSEIHIPKNGCPIDIFGQCLGCYSEVVIKSPVTAVPDLWTERFFQVPPWRINLKVFAALIIQRAWRRYISKKKGLEHEHEPSTRFKI